MDGVEDDRPTGDHRAEVGHEQAREEFGGMNLGAGFFGWLVAVGVTVLVSSIVSAVVAAVGNAQEIAWSDAQREAGSIGVAAAIVLVLVLMIGYYAGGYVAGRMSRFDGGRQGVLVWLIGLVVTILAVAVGWAVGSEYNILDRVELPRLPIPGDQATLGGAITAVAALLGTLLAAFLGGKVGHRYHDKVDHRAFG